MTIFIPDAVFDDDHALEIATAAPRGLIIRRASRPDEIDDAEWQSAEAVIAYHRLAYDASVCARLRRCRILVRAGVGTDNVDLAAFAARGIPVCNVPDYGTTEVADHTLALILALARGIVEFHRGIAADPISGWDWRRWPKPVRRLAGQKLLIVGFGAIGRAVAQRAAGFGLDIGVFDPVAINVAGARRYATIEEGLADSDIVTLHAPLTDATRRLIDRRRITLMKPDAILVNTARGGLIDLDALHDGLAGGTIAGAGLDVLPHEPPDPEHPLLRALAADDAWLRGRLILTPHAAFLSADAIADMRRKSVETAVAYLNNGTLNHCVNRTEPADAPDPFSIAACPPPLSDII